MVVVVIMTVVGDDPTFPDLLFLDDNHDANEEDPDCRE
jgi:hypothetical protein